MKNPYKELSEKEREELILKYLPLVKGIAFNLKKNLPDSVDVRDLVGYGIIGLIRAIDNLKGTNRKSAESYIKLRIKGAIYDYLRSLDFGSRTVREKEKQLKEVMEKLKERLGREPTDEEIAKEMNLSREELLNLLHKISFSHILSLEEIFRENLRDYEEILKSGADNVEEKIIRKEFEEKLKEAIKKLPERERLVIQLIFYEELPMREVAKILNCSISRVAQLKSNALKKLKKELKPE